MELHMGTFFQVQVPIHSSQKYWLLKTHRCSALSLLLSNSDLYILMGCPSSRRWLWPMVGLRCGYHITLTLCWFLPSLALWLYSRRILPCRPSTCDWLSYICFQGLWSKAFIWNFHRQLHGTFNKWDDSNHSCEDIVPEKVFTNLQLQTYVCSSKLISTESI